MIKAYSDSALLKCGDALSVNKQLDDSVKQQGSLSRETDFCLSAVGVRCCKIRYRYLIQIKHIGPIQIILTYEGSL